MNLWNRSDSSLNHSDSSLALIHIEMWVKLSIYLKSIETQPANIGTVLYLVSLCSSIETSLLFYNKAKNPLCHVVPVTFLSALSTQANQVVCDCREDFTFSSTLPILEINIFIKISYFFVYKCLSGGCYFISRRALPDERPSVSSSALEE